LPGQQDVPQIRAGEGLTLVAQHNELGPLVLAGDGMAQALLCDNETNT
jgi:hypothetical protein